MAVSFCYGTVGSGKTYDAMCRVLEDMAAGHKVVTINMNLRPEQCLEALLKVHSMSRWDAGQALARHEAIYTESHFRTLRGDERRRIRLYADEAHFWWPKNTYYKMSIEDMLSASMSRKRQMDIHIISQLNDQINQDIKGLAADNWLARPLKVEPFYSGLKIYSRLSRAFGGYGRPAAFWYTRVEDELGRVRGRKDGTLDPDNKRLRFLHPLIAASYDTLEEVSSPILDRVRDEARFQYYVDILKGKIKPQAMCTVCAGRRRVRLSRFLDWAGAHPVQSVAVFRRGDWQHDYLLGVYVDDCPNCDGRGYTYPENHPDYEAARKIAQHLDTSMRRNKGREQDDELQPLTDKPIPGRVRFPHVK